MVHGAVRHIFRAVGLVALAIVVAAPLLIWRLSVGPLALDFLTPILKSAAVSRDGAWRADLDGTVLALGHGRHMIEIQAQGVRIYLGNEEKPALTVPMVAVSFNGRSLLAGFLAPSSIRIEGPHVRVVRDESGHAVFALNETQAVGQDIPLTLLDALTGEYDPLKPGRQLRELSISGAEVTFEDAATLQTLEIPWVDVTARRTGVGGAFTIAAALDRDQGAGTLQVKGEFQRGTGQWSVAVAATALRLAPFSRLSRSLEVLSVPDFPVTGGLHFAGGLQSGLQAVDVDLKGGEGRVRLLAPVGLQYPLSSFAVKAAVDLERKQVRVSDLKLALQDGSKLGANLQGDGIGGGPVALAVDAVYDHIAFDALKTLWPETVAPNPREWIVANLSKGLVRDGTITLAATWNPEKPDDLDVQKLAGKFKASGLSVNYISPMPQVHDGWGHASFDQKAFRVDIEGGQVAGLKVVGGTAVFTGLDQADQFAAIEVTASGALNAALRLIDQKPLGYATIMGIDPAVVGGDAVARLSLNFPLLKDLRLDDIGIKVHADIDGARLPKVFAGLDLTQGKLGLELDAKGMDVTGPIQLGGIPAGLEWRENFTTKIPFRSRYVIRAPSVEVRQLPLLGLDTPPFVTPWMEGAAAATVTVLMNGQGKADIDVAADLTPAKMTLPGLDWRKEVKTTGGAKVRIQVDGNRIVSVPLFDVVAGDLKTDGSVGFGSDGHAKRVDFKHLTYGRTAMQGAIDIGLGGALSLTMSGASFDATPIVAPDTDPSIPKTTAKDMQPIRVSAQFKKVWLSRPGAIADMTATLARDQGDWRTVAVKAKVGAEAKDFQFDIAPLGAKRRKLHLVSGDAGATMVAFDAYNDLVGGTMDIEGQFDDDKPGQPLAGTIHVGDYNVVHTPALARLLTVASLTGVVDVLKGEGISFSTLDAPFTLDDGVLKVKDARASGPALGLTANGEIDMDRNRLKLDGTLVPFYAINSVLGGVPVLGWLLNGGEKGGGLVAFNFSMKGSTDDPEVSLNPLSALTPGFLRHLFDIFDSGDDAGIRKGQ